MINKRLETLKNREIIWLTGNERYNWKGDQVGYRALHHWLRRCLGKASSCNFCGSNSRKRYHWANISGLYKRELTDFMSLCVSCHKIYDGNRLENRREYA